MSAAPFEPGRLPAAIGADLPRGLNWRRGAPDGMAAVIAKHGRGAHARRPLGKPLAPIPADPVRCQAAFQENLASFNTFMNAFGPYARFFARMNPDALGFDISTDMIDQTRRRFRGDSQSAHLTEGMADRLFHIGIERDPLSGDDRAGLGERWSGQKVGSRA